MTVPAWITVLLAFCLLAMIILALRFRLENRSFRQSRNTPERADSSQDTVERLQDFAEAASDWFWETDVEDRFTYFNGRHEEVTGIRESEKIGLTRREVSELHGSVDDFDSDAKMLSIQASIERLEAFEDISFWLEGPEGKRSYLSISGKPYFDDKGTFAGYRGIAADRTKAKLNEEEIAEGRHIYQQLVDLSPDAIVVQTTENGRISFANQAAAELVGIADPEELIGKDFVDFVHPDFRDSARERNRNAIHGGHSEPMAAGVFERVDGSQIPVQRSVTPCTLNGQPALISLVRDVSDQEKARAEVLLSEDRFRDFAESSSDFFWETNAEDRYSHFEGRSQGVTGLPRENLIGLLRIDSLKQNLTDADRADIEKWTEHERVIEERKPFQNFRMEMQHPDGSIIHLRVNGRPKFDDQGVYMGYRGTTVDESEEVEVRNAETKAWELLADAVESLEEGFALFDSKDCLVMFNDRYLDLVNKSAPGSLRIGRTFTDLLEEWVKGGSYMLSEDESQAFFDARLADHVNLPSRRTQQMGDGIWIETAERRTSDGGSVLILHNITESRQAEAAVRASESRLSGLLEMAPEATIVIDEQMNIQLFNTSAERIFGYEAKQVVGRHLEILLPQQFRKGHDALVGNFGKSPEMARPMSQRSAISALRQNGEEFPAEAAISKLVTPEGMIFTVMLRDVSQRVASETELARTRRHLEDAVNSSAQAIALWSPDTRLVLFNQHYVDLAGPAASLVKIGLQFSDLVYGVADAGVYGKRELGPEEYRQNRLAQFERRDGAPSYREMTDGRVIEIIDSRSHDGGTLTVCTDISEAHIREEALKEAMEATELANRAKSEFVANMSHELRTPLNAILGFAEVIVAQPYGEMGDARYLEYTHDIRDSGTHLLDIINDILDLSRIEARQLKLNEQRLNLAEIAERVQTMLAGRASAGGVLIKIDVPKTLPEITVDPRIFRQILVNLVTNGVKFTESGGRVTIAAEETPSGEILVSITDTGVGIAPEDMDRILEPFGQADGSLTRRFEGVGLGLPLTKSFVEVHGGELILESKVGVGTKVTVRLPRGRVGDLALQEAGRQAEQIL